jgi:hypothetical protein
MSTQQWRRIIRKEKLEKEVDKSCGLVSMRLNLQLDGEKPAQCSNGGGSFGRENSKKNLTNHVA